MSNKCELGESYKDTVFLGTGKFYLRVGQSSYKELHFSSDDIQIIKKVNSIDEASGTGIFYDTSTQDIVFVIDDVPIVQNNLKASKQELTEEQQKQILENLGLIGKEDKKDIPYIYYNSEKDEYIFKSKDKNLTLFELIQKAFTSSTDTGSEGSSGEAAINDAIKDKVLKIINSENIDFTKAEYSVSINKNKLFKLNNDSVTFNVDKLLLKADEKKFHLTSNELLIDTIITNNIITSEAPAVTSSDIILAIQNAKEISDITSLLEELNSISIQEGDWLISLNLSNGIVNGYPKSIIDSKGNKVNVMSFYQSDNNKFDKIIAENGEDINKLRTSLINHFNSIKCVYLRDERGNQGNFNFYQIPSKDDKWAFGGTTNLVNNVSNTSISKGQVIEFTDHLNNVIMFTDYFKCVSADNSIIGVNGNFGTLSKVILLGNSSTLTGNLSNICICSDIIEEKDLNTVNDIKPEILNFLKQINDPDVLKTLSEMDSATIQSLVKVALKKLIELNKTTP